MLVKIIFLAKFLVLGFYVLDLKRFLLIRLQNYLNRSISRSGRGIVLIVSMQVDNHRSNKLRMSFQMLSG